MKDYDGLPPGLSPTAHKTDEPRKADVAIDLAQETEDTVTGTEQERLRTSRHDNSFGNCTDRLARPIIVGLGLSYWIIVIILLLNLPQSAQANHVVFEQIGELAGALSYLHVKLTLNLTSIEANFEQYQTKLKTLREDVEKVDNLGKFYFVKDVNTARSNHQSNVRDMLTLFKEQHIAILDNYIENSKRFNASYRAIISSLPATTKSIAPDHKFEIRRKKRDGGMVLGILGTFMGIYNTYQLVL
jgi:hypothetical protein